MYRFLFIGLSLFFFGCKNEITPSDLNLLNGYWNIDYITHKSETFQTKGYAKLIDFYEITDRVGVRKKAQPQLNNKFFVTEDSNNFKIIFKGRTCYLSFQTTWDQWQEKIITLNKNQLILGHQEKRYHYKRFHNED